ncbi:MAG TPA: hypothetical protein VG501_11970 [Rhizomicrobium sp.]|nr:hypothetical protein [Rhizomicrobium sp.]
MRKAGWFWALLLAAPAATVQAAAQAWDGTIPAYQFFPGNAELDINALAGGAAFSASGHNGQNASGAAKLMPRLHRDFDSGLSIGLDATLTAADPLSRGRYGGALFEKAYGDVRTGLGRLEIGETDGAAYDLAVTGPKMDDQVSLDNPQTSFFRDPSTGRAFTEIFALRTEVGASSNYAKFAYVSPSLFGAQLALSFTPNQSRAVPPFVHAGPHAADRQADIWEGAIRYEDELGPVSFTAYGGVAEGRGEHKRAGQEGVSDYGFGLKADYPVNDELSFSLGGAFRQSNAYAFDIAQSFNAATTRARQASASVNYGSWILGLEYGDGNAGQVPGAPHLSLAGYQAGLAYQFSSSIQASIGWQRLNYARGGGSFYNGNSRIGLDAGFVHLTVKTSNN